MRKVRQGGWNWKWVCWHPCGAQLPTWTWATSSLGPVALGVLPACLPSQASSCLLCLHLDPAPLAPWSWKLASTFSARSASLTLPACWCCALHGLVRVSVQESRRAECLLGSGCAALGCSDSQHRPPEPPHVFWGRWDSQERTGDLGEDGSASGSRLFLALVSSSPNL